MTSESAAREIAAALEERVDHVALVLDSYARVTGRSLLSRGTAEEDARALYHAPFVVLTHAPGPDPLFTYGNRAAQSLFEVSPEELLALRSRLSAEPAKQEERQRSLQMVTERGYIDDYAGIRVSRTGRRFRIEGATIWNLVDDLGVVQGQAATFAQWTRL